MTKHQLGIFSVSVFAAFALLLAAASPAPPSDDASDLKGTVESLESQVSDLEAKVDELENELTRRGYCGLV